MSDDVGAFEQAGQQMAAGLADLPPEREVVPRSAVVPAGTPVKRSGHDLTITSRPHHGSVPFVFRARCGCGWSYGFNAWKWVALGIQDHLTDVALMNGRGRLAES